LGWKSWSRFLKKFSANFVENSTWYLWGFIHLVTPDQKVVKMHTFKENNPVSTKCCHPAICRVAWSWFKGNGEQETVLVCRNELGRWRFLLTATGVVSGWIRWRVVSTGTQCTSVGYSRSLWSKRVASHLKRSWRIWTHLVVRIRVMIVAVVLVGLVNARRGRYVVDYNFFQMR
jgi:hypothetical protein